MVFKGITRDFSLTDEQQYETIGAFWDEMAAQYGLENLQGLGYHWHGSTMSYAIGLKTGCIPNHNASILLPEDGWICVKAQTDNLKQLYDTIYQDGALLFEIETFYENGDCRIQYYRRPD